MCKVIGERRGEARNRAVCDQANRVRMMMQTSYGRECILSGGWGGYRWGFRKQEVVERRRGGGEGREKRKGGREERRQKKALLWERCVLQPQQQQLRCNTALKTVQSQA